MYKILTIIYLQLNFVVGAAQSHYDRQPIQHLFQTQDFEQAVTILKAFQAPHTEEYLNDLGYAQFMNGDYQAAKSSFYTLTGINNQLAAPLYYLALLYEQERAADSSLGYYKRLVQLFPAQFRYWQGAARQWSHLKNTDSAIAYIQKAHDLRPASGSVVYEYSNYLVQKKQLVQAEALIDRFLASDSSYDRVTGQKVNLSFKAARYKEAIKWGEWLRSRNASTPVPYINLLYSYLNENQPDSVISIYKWMGINNMMGESVAYGTAIAYAMKKNYAISDSLLDECVAFNIQEMAATYLRKKAANAEATKNYKKAIAYYDSAYYIFHNPEDIFQSGKVYDAFLKDRVKATAYYKKFLSVCPSPRTGNEEKITAYIKEFLNPEK